MPTKSLPPRNGQVKKSRDGPSEQPLPHNQDAERALLGSILLDNGCFKALGEIDRNDFFADRHRFIFDAITRLFQHNSTVDLVTLTEDLTHTGLLEKAGGVAYIASLSDGVPMGDYSFVTNYATIIKKKARARAFINMNANLMSRAFEDADIDELTTEARTQLEVLTPVSTNSDSDAQDAPEKGLECPTIKRECCYGISSWYLDAVAESTEASDSFHFLSFLIAAGAGLGKYISFRQSKIIYPNLWGVLVGVSSKARKGTAMSYAMNLVREACSDQVEPLTSIDSWEGIVEVMSLARAKSADASHVIQLEEMRSLLELSSQKGMGKLIPKLCELYDCINPVRKATAHDSRVIDPPPSVSFLAGTTKSWMRKLTIDEIEGGLGNRLCFFAGEKKKIENAENPPPPKADILTHVLTELQQARAFWKERAMQTSARTTQLTFAPDAKNKWREFYNDDLSKRGDEDPLIEVLSSRDSLHAIKALMIFAGLERASQVTLRQLDAAIAFANFLLESRYYIFRGFGVKKWVEQEMMIIDALREVGERGIRAKKLAHRFHRKLSNKEFWDRVKALTGNGNGDGPVEQLKVGKMIFLRLSRR
ncbi:MAG TPA: DnaB-like helicase N-terminal domain-containing protein [Terriglobia bacterium]|nr:DnaB-like helicase N-terminal domain-containing protein [Terriglobia bacterium]